MGCDKSLFMISIQQTEFDFAIWEREEGADSNLFVLIPIQKFVGIWVDSLIFAGSMEARCCSRCEGCGVKEGRCYQF